MEWHDEGIVLSARPHGETAAILDLFTRAHGRHAGVVRGGVGRRLRPVLQPGGDLAVRWQARLEDHLGSYTVEPLRTRTALLDHRLTLAGLSSATALLALALPERDPHPRLHAATGRLLDLPPDPLPWARAYLAWELQLLESLGFGLDLHACAVSGATEGLAYVSPRSGRAVARGAAGDWAPRLLPLPPVMLGQGDGPPDEIATALATTGWFITHRLLAAHGAGPPPARARFLAEIARLA
ncbi:MAG: DNA repair protein RecO [Rubellimicrobium sp.]|nr:DNA repair protein RecO [Rubellimicrobium sp.]